MINFDHFDHSKWTIEVCGKKEKFNGRGEFLLSVQKEKKCAATMTCEWRWEWMKKPQQKQMEDLRPQAMKRRESGDDFLVAFLFFLRRVRRQKFNEKSHSKRLIVGGIPARSKGWGPWCYDTSLRSDQAFCLLFFFWMREGAIDEAIAEWKIHEIDHLTKTYFNSGNIGPRSPCAVEREVQAGISVT